MGKPYIKISRSEVLFEQYRMALNWDKYYIEVRNDDAIKRNQILFDFMQRTFNRLYGSYLHGKCILIDSIIKYQTRKHPAAEIEKLNREKKARNKRKEGTSKNSPNKACFVNKPTPTSKSTSNTSNSKFNANIPR